MVDIVKNLMDMQQKTFAFWYENTKTPLDYIKDHDQIVENTIKFHKAAVSYHQSIVQMTEAYNENCRLLGLKKLI